MIENQESIEIYSAQKCAALPRRRAGRKPVHATRATEIRQRLIAWRQMPESSRPSLRALEVETGVSHQLLSFYHKGLEEWEYNEWCRKAKETAKKEAEGIAARAEAQGRAMTMREHLLAMGYVTMILEQIEELRQAGKRGPLNRHQVQILKLHARQFPIAQEILRRCKQMTPEEEKQARALERKAMFTSPALYHIERIKQEAERGPLCWQDVERLKYFARRKCAEAKELLQKHVKSAEPRPQGVTQ